MGNSTLSIQSLYSLEDLLVVAYTPSTRAPRSSHRIDRQQIQDGLLLASQRPQNILSEQSSDDSGRGGKLVGCCGRQVCKQGLGRGREGTGVDIILLQQVVPNSCQLSE